MSDELQKEIFSRNLRRYISISGKQQNEIAKELGISPQRLNTWTQGIALPRMGAVQMLADYFHIEKSDLLEIPRKAEEYYTNEETARLAQEMFDDPDMRALFDMKRNMDPERFQAHMDMMKRLYKLEHPEEFDDTGC